MTFNWLIFCSGRVIEFYKGEEFNAAFDRLYSPGCKYGMWFFKNKPALTLIGSLNRSEAPKLLPERYMLEPLLLTFRLRNFMFEAFDEKILQLVEAHFISYYLKYDNRDSYLKKLQRHVKPFKVLTLDELEAGFVVSTSPLILCLLVFCIEWLITLKDLLVFLCIFGAYFEMRKKEQDKLIELKEFRIATLEIMFKKNLAKENDQIESSSSTQLE